jgi:sugar phosphate permease
MTAFAMCMMHSVRSSWPYVKDKMNILFSDTDKSTLDFLQIQGGAWCFILLAWTADKYNPKYVTTFGLIFLGVVEILTGFLMNLGMKGKFTASMWIYYFLFILNGVG